MPQSATKTAPVGPETIIALPERAIATRLLGLLGGVLIVTGAWLAWLPFPDSSGVGAPISMLWSIDYIETEYTVSLFNSAGIVVILIGLFTVIGALIGRKSLVRIGGLLGLVVFALIVVSLLRLDVLGIGVGDIGLGVWAIGLGAVIAIVGGFISHRSTI